MRELVQHGDGAAFHLGVGDLAAEDVAFQDGDGPGVFHGAGVELRHEELVVLLERVRAAELGLEELETLPGEFEDVVGIEVLHERLAGEDAQRGDPAIRRLVTSLRTDWYGPAISAVT